MYRRCALEIHVQYSTVGNGGTRGQTPSLPLFLADIKAKPSSKATSWITTFVVKLIPYANLCLENYLDQFFWEILSWLEAILADITRRIVSQNSYFYFYMTTSLINLNFWSIQYSVQNWAILCNNLYVFVQNTFNIDLNYILKQFLAIFETFN